MSSKRNVNCREELASSVNNLYEFGVHKNLDVDRPDRGPELQARVPDREDGLVLEEEPPEELAPAPGLPLQRPRRELVERHGVLQRVRELRRLGEGLVAALDRDRGLDGLPPTPLHLSTQMNNNE